MQLHERAETQTIISLTDLAVTYRTGPVWNRVAVPAVNGVTLQIAAGETVGLVGESGSGKTTLGRVMLGLVRPSAGKFLFQQRPFHTGLRRAGALSVVFQHPEWALNPRLRCASSIAEPLHIQQVGDRAERHEQVAAMLAQVGLDPALATRFPGELSGGQRQRMAIARALITHPRFIVFDEAVSALDVSIQAQILNLIRDLQAQHGFAALFISHDLAATRYISHRIAVMRAGAFVEVAPAAQFYGTPDHPYSRSLREAIV
ncbi:MAG TPA: ATP-binding cassette domain-containing protein [Ramlibacter sp.]|nr:ATP-binding cassette domain-containing protein [Ramlibacter sp.]